MPIEMLELPDQMSLMPQLWGACSNALSKPEAHHILADFAGGPPASTTLTGTKVQAPVSLLRAISAPLPHCTQHGSGVKSGQR